MENSETLRIRSSQRNSLVSCKEQPSRMAYITVSYVPISKASTMFNFISWIWVSNCTRFELINRIAVTFFAAP